MAQQHSEEAGGRERSGNGYRQQLGRRYFPEQDESRQWSQQGDNMGRYPSGGYQEEHGRQGSQARGEWEGGQTPYRGGQYGEDYRGETQWSREPRGYGRSGQEEFEYGRSYGQRGRGYDELSGQGRYGGPGGRYGQEQYDPYRQSRYGQEQYGRQGPYRSPYGERSFGQGSYGPQFDEQSPYQGSPYMQGGFRGGEGGYGVQEREGGFGERGFGRDDDGRYRSGRVGQAWGRAAPGRDGPMSGEGLGQQRQSFRGKGPKGYERSDERLKELICERLTDDDEIDASDITVDVRNGEVTLSGTVDDRRTKYLVEELVERCGGVKEIHNNLRLSRGQEGREQQGLQGTRAPKQQRSGQSSATAPGT
jgi:hypothetical protein